MDLLALSLGFLSDINWVLIAQLTMLALVLLAGPVVIFALAAFKGDL
ncbi:photosystem II reaction center protein Ycf12/Psb30 [Limnofasciculus baicalensis]|uniref:Photosystem II reaction center protein Psb30 n=1 Tax=Limnofasciculus baicalensis BBK-W-15 TaxID=2699891 RepID=A0AAE3GRR7_9CYAN|nr:photosystem II reaction center protein Ycf12 [Limnofasciculus baicalensis]MCP2729505.1 photosystem II reaction center protein Ycf12 [Limnofasciculus baicalensis BBK-W-15]